MNKKTLFAMVLLAATLFVLLSCAKDADQESSETTEEETAKETPEDYSPVVIDELTEDFEEMDW